jgi:predicted nuclease with TOPRIM domain
MSDYDYDEGYRAGMQKMREVGQSKIATQRNEIARLTQKLEELTKEKAALTKDIQWMRGEEDET